MTDPNSQVYQYVYNDVWWLIRQTDPVGAATCSNTMSAARPSARPPDGVVRLSRPVRSERQVPAKKGLEHMIRPRRNANGSGPTKQDSNDWSSTDGRALPAWQVLAGFAVSAFIAAVIIYVLWRVGHVPPERGTYLVLGVTMWLAGLQRPRWLYDVIRNLGWYVVIPGWILRWLFVVAGTACLAVAWFG